MNMKKTIALVTIVAAVAAIALIARGGSDVSGSGPASDQAAARIAIPATFSEAAKAGEGTFNATCAACHGKNAAGTEAGPPLIHRIYEPSHHGDYAFVMAVANGVRAHHWKFGDMPPQPGVTRDQMAGIIAYVRELQRANGIN